MSAELSFFLLCFTSFITLMNPIGIMPVFLSMTADLDQKQRTKTALKAVIVAFFTLMLFAFSGQILFKFFGISVNSFRVVGGVIFFMMGYDMLQARLTKIKIHKSDVKNYVDDISVTPLAIPMICGPGAITNAIVLMEDAVELNSKVILISTILGICIIIFLVLWGASQITKFIGPTGNKILMRLMGLIVMVIAVEFFFSGLKPILIDIFSSIPR